MQEKLRLERDNSKDEKIADLSIHIYRCLEVCYNVYSEGFYEGKSHHYSFEKPLECMLGQCYALGRTHSENGSKMVSKKDFIEAGYAN